VQRAIDWMLSMQCKNGGWASFDKDNDKMVFQHIPFADHNAMLDPQRSISRPHPGNARDLRL